MIKGHAKSSRTRSVAGPRPALPQEGAWLKFWGVRGSIPAPGRNTVHYGGNTSCVEVRAGGEIIILDSGTGIRPLGRALVAQSNGRPISVNLLITHTHWDHIQGFPFFLPAYEEKNTVAIWGRAAPGTSLRKALEGQMNSPYFPVEMKQLRSHLSVREMQGPIFQIGQVHVRTQLVDHPGTCTGFRLSTSGGDIVYLPDVELRSQPRSGAAVGKQSSGERSEDVDGPGIVDFIRDCDVLILDSQYQPSELRTRAGWGHSSAEESVSVAINANVKHLFLFHHDPDHDDAAITRIVARARRIAAASKSSLRITAAREGMVVRLPKKQPPLRP
jgi:phosphoribosyl 1,2-cyclic phosphodiesterase